MVKDVNMSARQFLTFLINLGDVKFLMLASAGM